MEKHYKHASIANTEKKVKKIRLLYVINDLHSFSKNGLLSEAAMELPLELKNSDVEIQIIQPFFSDLRHNGLHIRELNLDFQVILADKSFTGSFVKVEHPEGLEIVCIKNEGLCGTCNSCFDKYAEDIQNLYRLSFFCHAVFSYIQLSNYKPDIIHCMGWETGLIPALYKKIFMNDEIYRDIRTVFSVYNFFTQGNFEASLFPYTGLPWTCFNLHEMEFWGKFSFIKAGIVYSDALMIIGETKTDYFFHQNKSFGLHGALLKRKETIYGIQAGMNDKWDPSADSCLTVNYSGKEIDKKMQNKISLIKRLRLSVNAEMPFVALVGDLSYYNIQGDNLERTIEILCQLDASFIFAGKVNSKMLEKLRYFNEKTGCRHAFLDEEGLDVIHNLLGSVDVLLLPCSYRALPLLPLYALRYGTIPVVSKIFGGTSGIEPFNRRTGEGEGFYFEECTLISMLGKVISVINALRYEGFHPVLIKNAMNVFLKWENGLAKIIKVYKHILSVKNS